MAEESQNKLIPTDEVIDAKIEAALEEPLRTLQEHGDTLASKADGNNVYDKTTVDSKVKTVADAVAEHVANNTLHISDSEREIWNNKPDSSEIYTRKQSDKIFAHVYHEHTSDEWFVSVKDEVASKYTKPNGGIPGTDMTEAVKNSLSLANTALQEHQDIRGKLDKQYGNASIGWDDSLPGYFRIKNAILELYSEYGGTYGIQIGGNTLFGDVWKLTSTLRAFQKIQLTPDAQLTFLDGNLNEESIEDRIKRLSSLAPKYSTSSAYSVGQYIFHDGSIYRCTTAIALPGEAWNPAHWSGAQKLDDFFTNSNSLLTATIDEEVISKGTAPDAHLESPTDERLKLVLADNSVAYDSEKALPYKLTSVIGDRVIATMTLTAASTDITLPTIAANDTTVKDFILDVTNAYAVEGVATDAGINIPRTDFKLVTRDGESLTDVTTVKAGKSAFLCFTQKSPVVVGGTTYPCWCVIQLPFGDPS